MKIKIELTKKEANELIRKAIETEYGFMRPTECTMEYDIKYDGRMEITIEKIVVVGEL